MNKPVVLRPRVSEKAYALSGATNTYIFDIPKDANKHSVAEAVASQFKVTVTSVRTASIAGKLKRSYRKRGRNIAAKRSDVRKAYVTLKTGDKLPLFDATKEEPKAAKETN